MNEQQREKGCGGSVMMEALLALPVTVLLILGSLQVSHLAAMRQQVFYAAYCGARAALACSEQHGEFEGPSGGPERAAEEAAAWIALEGGSDGADLAIPGWGDIVESGAVREKTRVAVERHGAWNILTKLTFDASCVVPVAGELLAAGAMETGACRLPRPASSAASPVLPLAESVCLPKPYLTVVATEWR